MKDVHTLARVAEAERILQQAIADAPLTCSAQETAAAMQGLGLRLAEACMPAKAIARNLIDQAEAYLRAAGQITEPANDPDEITDGTTQAAHRILTEAAKAMVAAGIPATTGRHLMLGYAAAWVSRDDTHSAAESLYRHADALIGRDRKRASH